MVYAQNHRRQKWTCTTPGSMVHDHESNNHERNVINILSLSTLPFVLCRENLRINLHVYIHQKLAIASYFCYS